MSVQSIANSFNALVFRDAALALATSRYETAPDDYKIYWFPDENEETVRFIEVDTDTIPTGNAMIFAFGKNTYFPFRSEIAQVTPDEWERVQAGLIPLPDTWVVSSAVLAPRLADSSS